MVNIVCSRVTLIFLIFCVTMFTMDNFKLSDEFMLTAATINMILITDKYVNGGHGLLTHFNSSNEDETKHPERKKEKDRVRS